MTGAGPLRFDDLGFARPDVGREERQGLAEVVYGPGKQTGEIVALVRHALSANAGPVLVTRVDAAVAAEVTAALTAAVDGGMDGGEACRRPRLLAWRPAAPIGFTVAVVSAGTADGPVAREAEAVARVLGLSTEYVPDVGVAGIHRVLAEVDRLRGADAVICVAGMEGALASVVGGLVAAPVIAVPTSVGYGASFEGVTALLAMMSSCAAGTVVVNIDSGFGAAVAAFRIARTARKGRAVILALQPSSGVSGDMLLGALLDAGAPLDGVRECVASTGLTGWRLDVERGPAGGLVATRAVVHVADDVPERRAAELLDLVRRAAPAPVAELAGRAIAAIAGVEAELHGEDPDDVHLHELGGLDTVVDTVGVAAALHLLGVTAVHSAPVAVGTGTVRTRHGVLPVPAPATAALLRAAGAIVAGADVDGETVTPTGAALLAAAGTVFGPVPAMRIARIGYGAGTKTFPGRPNVLQAILGEPVGGSVTTEVVVETNVDDVTPEVLAYVLARALDEGAADAWVTPIVMKKGRPAHTLHVLAPADRADAIAALLFAETGTLGVRRTAVEKLALPRHTSTVDVDGHPVRVKHGPHGGKPEHDDVAAAARATGRPAREVAAEALRLSAEE